MYLPPPYAGQDPQAIAAAVRAHPFATLVVNGDDGPIAAYAPMAVECDDAGAVIALVGHVARANPFWSKAAGATALAIFAGPDGYVSPSFYPSKAEHGRVVPTWNYVRVEARGVVAIETDPAAMRPYIDAPTAQMEALRAHPWASADAPSDYLAALERGIVGVRIAVSEIHGKWKLDQKKAPVDRAGAAAGLRAEGRAALADLMER